MRLFFIHVLGVRPESLQNRRHARGEAPREWCTDGVAASSCAPGIMGLVLAFRGEVEAQGRGFLHPHILIWLVCVLSLEMLRILGREPGLFRQRVAQWNVVRPGARRVARNAQSRTVHMACGVQIRAHADGSSLLQCPSEEHIHPGGEGSHNTQRRWRARSGF